METHVCGYGIRVLHPIRHDGWSWHEVAASMKREPVRKQKDESPWEKTGKCQMGDFCPLKKVICRSRLHLFISLRSFVNRRVRPLFAESKQWQLCPTSSKHMARANIPPPLSKL